MDSMKSKNGLIGILTIVFVVCFALNSFAADATWVSIDNSTVVQYPQFKLIEESPDHLILQWKFYGISFEDVSQSQRVFQKLTIPGESSANVGKIGAPALPAVMEIIAVPSGFRAEAHLVSADWKEIGKFHIFPNQHPALDNTTPSPEFTFDEEAYSLKTPQPTEVTVATTTQGWGGIPVAGVMVSPFQYNALDQSLQIAFQITVRIDFIPDGHNFIRQHSPSRILSEIQRAALVNFPPDRAFDFDENEPVRMLVVLKEEALEIATPLIDYHYRTGTRTDVFIADDLEDAEELKALVQQYYEEGLEYLFLIGDPYYRSWDVPMFDWDPEDPGQEVANTDTHSDTWYACMDGPDIDGFVDNLPDLAVGRLTYSDSDALDELALQIDKIMDYTFWTFEDPENVDWLDRAVMVAAPQTVDRVLEFINCKRDVIEQQYTHTHPEMIPYFGNDDNVSVNTLVDEVNGDGLGFFNYRGHGTPVRMDLALHNRSIDRNIVRLFDNRQMPFIVVSSACQTGNSATRISDCILESFQKEVGGSVAAHGSIISTFTDGNTYFDKEIYKSWFTDNIRDLGFAANLAMTRMVLNFDTPNRVYRVIGRMNARTYHWLADPAMEYRKNPPMELVVDIPDEVVPATRFINGNVQQVENATVCINNVEGTVYQVTTTDENGDFTIEFDPAIPEPGQLHWAVRYPDGIPAFGDILVADGFGSIGGVVTELENGQPVENVEIIISPFNVEATTDVDGYYLIERIPERAYTITASAEGYISEIRDDVQVVEDELTELNLQLSYSDMLIVDEPIARILVPDAALDVPLSMGNTGNGTLTWTASLETNVAVEPFSLIDSLELSQRLGDTRINGIVYTEDRLIVAGGNNNSDPNFIYILDRDGNPLEEEYFQQPLGSAGIGIHDLCWDGQYVYGSSGPNIFQFDLNGELNATIPGPFNPNVALAVDDDGMLWVANNRSAIARIDLDGNILQQIPNDLPIRGLAWDSSAEDGMNLLMYVRSPENSLPLLYDANPATNEIRQKADLSRTEGEIPADGLSVSDFYHRAYRTLLSMANVGAERYLRVWVLNSHSEWLAVNPQSGTIAPDESSEITLTFDATNLNDGRLLETMLIIENNGRTPLFEIPVRLAVDADASIENENLGLQPETVGLSAPFPNPFNSTTQVKISLTNSQRINLSLIDLNGRVVNQIADGYFTSGEFNFTVNGNSMPSGVYFLVLGTSEAQYFQKLALIR